MRWTTFLLGIVLAWTAATGLLLADPIDTDMLRRKQESQQRARDSARELVSTVLDIQLQQLDENGLKNLPLYRDIEQMRTNLDGLIEAEMADVVNLFLRAQEQPPAEREKTFVAARQKIRDVVVRLSIERQNLLRRLKTAELAALVKRLIGLQTVTYDVTRSLGEQPQNKQESLLLSSIQDERDIKALYLRLVETLDDVRSWGGDVGEGAAEGATILRAAGIDRQLDTAIAALEQADFPKAGEGEAAVLKGLRLLLEKIEETQGLVVSDREPALELVRELSKSERELRKTTAAANLDEPTIDKLLAQQSAIKKDLDRLPELLGQVPAAVPLVNRARNAAYDAAGKLFEADRDGAVARQDQVLENLAAVEQQLAANSATAPAPPSAADFEQLLTGLEQTIEKLNRAQTDTAQASLLARTSKANAGNLVDRVAKQLAAIPAEHELPAIVKARVEDAAAAAEATKPPLRNQATGTQASQTALAKTGDAIERARAEASAALADARRQRLAVEAGELNRAAEAVDRAAAAERDVERESSQAAPAGLADDEAKRLAAQHAAAEQVARHAAEAVKSAAPAAHEALRDAAPALAKTGENLRQAREGKSARPELAARTAETAGDAANRLEEAARRIRSAIAATAQQLSAEVAGQKEQLEPVEKGVEEAAAPPRHDRPEMLAALRKAEELTRQASAEQQRAAGRPAAADAMELARQIARARQQQRAADRAAEDLARGNSDTPLEAATAQQRAAEEVARAARQAELRPQAPEKGDPQPDPLGAELRKAELAATQAGEHALDGRMQQAAARRDDTRKALERAEKLAAAEQQAAESQPADKPDAASQQRAASAARSAAATLAAQREPAAETLSRAAEHAARASRQLDMGNASAATEAQRDAAGALSQAEKEIEELRKSLEAARADDMREAADRARQLADQASKVDPSAQAALRSAERRAQRTTGTESAEQANAADDAIHQDLERAGASLSARRQRLDRDAQLAQSIAKAAAQQGQAAEKLQQSAGEQTSGNRPTPSGNKPSIAEAMKQFEAAARAVGQSAEEVAGQREIGNEDLRKALAAGDQLAEQPTPEASKSQQAAASPQADGPPQAGAMGRQFTPASADRTAQMVSGGQAIEPEAAGQPQPPGTPHRPASGANTSGLATQKSSSESSVPGSTQASQSAATDKSSTASTGQRGPEAAGQGESDTPKPGERTFREEPWVAKLPPELRQAIRAESRRPPPRGYEERLKRYFENID